MTHGLANVFVNDQRVEDLDNPELKIRDIIEAYGRDPDRCIVYKLQSQDDQRGEPVRLDDTLDLASARGAVFLRCETRRTEAMAPSPGGGEADDASEDEEDLSEFERVPAYEGTLGGQEERPAAAAESEDEEPWSPEGPKHAQDAGAHQYYDRDATPRWESEESLDPATIEATEQKPRALGSELRDNEGKSRTFEMKKRANRNVRPTKSRRAKSRSATSSTATRAGTAPPRSPARKPSRRREER